MDRKLFDLHYKIAERGRKMGLCMFSNLSLLMDLEAAQIEYDLDCERLLKANDFNFAHDICGIQKHIDREQTSFACLPPKIVFEKCFLPRFTRPAEELTK
jgi:hypothetical protein